MNSGRDEESFLRVLPNPLGRRSCDEEEGHVVGSFSFYAWGNLKQRGSLNIATSSFSLF